MKTTFLKKYLLFYVSVLVVVIPLELIFSPNHRVTIAEYGWGYFIRNSLMGMGILYALLSFIGLLILLKMEYTPVRMGVLSLVLGFIIEFLFMKPGWVYSIARFQITVGIIIAVLLSAFYWFAVWGFPSYMLKRYTAVIS
ncbi:MAG: hypothetical protein HXS44_02270 [Theionarchaea archaeon]|nr:hypothetical protein [Theionarchaea archaeon]